jgi:hypothetical protein
MPKKNQKKAKNRKRVKKSKSKENLSLAVIKQVSFEPIKEKGKLMIPNTWMKKNQVMRMVTNTPSRYVYQRKGKGGQVFDYVTGNYVKQVLNYVFGWLWDFEILNQGREGNMVWVLGKLTVKDGKGNSIVKTQYGRADIKFYKDKSKGMLDFGNDLKAAATDSLKKCASELGIAADVYGKNELREDKPQAIQDIEVVEAREIVISQPKLSKEDYDKLLIAMVNAGYSNKQKMLAGIKRLLKVEVKDLPELTKSQATTVMAALLSKKHNGK